MPKKKKKVVKRKPRNQSRPRGLRRKSKARFITGGLTTEPIYIPGVVLAEDKPKHNPRTFVEIAIILAILALLAIGIHHVHLAHIPETTIRSLP